MPDPTTEIEITLRGIKERDIDLLLLEELVANPGFCTWFIARLGLNRSSRLQAAARSVLSSTGESDLALRFQDGNRRTIVLVENKVDAALQPRQAERYAERAAAYLKAGTCERVVTVLIAPRAYRAGDSGFDRRLTDEAVLRHLCRDGGGDARSLFKRRLLMAAIDRGEAGWTLVPDAAATDFWRRYWEVAEEHAPDLRMPRPDTKPANSSFVRFRPLSLPRGVELIHKVNYGNVDLQFNGRAREAVGFEKTIGRHLERGMRIDLANKSLVVRVNVPRIRLNEPFEMAEATVRSALRAARKLLRWHSRWIGDRGGLPKHPQRGDRPAPAQPRRRASSPRR